MIGMEEVIDWPAPEPRPWATAITTYRPLDAPDRWMNGVKWTPYGCADTTGRALDDECSDALQTFTAPTAFDSVVTFRPFLIEAAFECSTLGGMGVNGEKLYQHALDVTEQDRSRQLARQVMFRPYNTTNPSLLNEADVVTTNDVTPAGALANVEDGLAARLNNARGMIHMTPGVFTRLQAGGGFIRSGDEWFTATGHRIVADAGYAGSGNQAGQSWIYGSGPVRYKLGPLSPVSSSWENFDWENNIVEAQVHQWALAIFEPCVVVGARADVAT